MEPSHNNTEISLTELLDKANRRAVARWFTRMFQNLLFWCHCTSKMERLEFAARVLINFVKFQEHYLYGGRPSDLTFNYTPLTTPRSLISATKQNDAINEILDELDYMNPSKRQRFLHHQMIIVMEDEITDLLDAGYIAQRLRHFRHMSQAEKIEIRMR